MVKSIFLHEAEATDLEVSEVLSFLALHINQDMFARFTIAAQDPETGAWIFQEQEILPIYSFTVTFEISGGLIEFEFAQHFDYLGVYELIMYKDGEIGDRYLLTPTAYGYILSPFGLRDGEVDLNLSDRNVFAMLFSLIQFGNK